MVRRLLRSIRPGPEEILADNRLSESDIQRVRRHRADARPYLARIPTSSEPGVPPGVVVLPGESWLGPLVRAPDPDRASVAIALLAEPLIEPARRVPDGHRWVMLAWLRSPTPRLVRQDLDLVIRLATVAESPDATAFVATAVLHGRARGGDLSHAAPALQRLWRTVDAHDAPYPNAWFVPRADLAEAIYGLGVPIDGVDPPPVDSLPTVSSSSTGGAVAALQVAVRRLETSGPIGRQRLADFLASARPESWLAIDASMRTYRSAPPPPLLAGEPDVALLGLASMGREGHVRESTTRDLAGRTEPVAAGFLALRSVDWVPAIREIALPEVVRRLRSDQDAAAVAIPILHALALRSRAALGFAELDAIVAASPELQRRLARNRDPVTRRHAVGIAIDEGTLAGDDLIELAVSDPDTVVATRAGVAVIARAAEGGDIDTLARLLGGRPQVRRAALDAWPDSSPKALETARGRLFDRSPLVRTGAQNLMRRLGGHPAADYRDALHGDRAAIALIELGLIGNRRDRELVLAALDDPDPRIRRAAASAISWLDPEALVDALGRLVDDPSPAVAVAAARRLRRVARRVPAETANKWLRRPEPGVRLAGLAIARRRTDYERLEADLLLIDDPDERVRRVARRDLAASWPKRATAFTPRHDLATRQRIGGLLDAARTLLPEQTVADIQFAAGVRPPDLR